METLTQAPKLGTYDQENLDNILSIPADAIKMTAPALREHFLNARDIQSKLPYNATLSQIQAANAPLELKKLEIYKDFLEAGGTQDQFDKLSENIFTGNYAYLRENFPEIVPPS